MRPLVALAVMIFFLLLAVARVQAQEEEEYVYGVGDTLAAIDIAAADYGVSWRRLFLIVDCETGHSLNPYSLGRAGERGAVQLHPRGELPRFYRYGFDNEWSPYQAVAYLAIRLNEGAARAWTCARL